MKDCSQRDAAKEVSDKNTPTEWKHGASNYPTPVLLPVMLQPLSTHQLQ